MVDPSSTGSLTVLPNTKNERQALDDGQSQVQSSSVAFSSLIHFLATNNNNTTNNHGQ